MKYYLDEDLSQTIAEIARSLGLDVVSSHQCGRDGLAHEEQLRLAGQEGRCLVTRNRGHFVLLTVRFFDNVWPHSGVLLVPDSLPPDQFAAVAKSLLSFDGERPEGIGRYCVDFLRGR